jgi:hypothetical protein
MSVAVTHSIWSLTVFNRVTKSSRWSRVSHSKSYDFSAVMMEKHFAEDSNDDAREESATVSAPGREEREGDEREKWGGHDRERLTELDRDDGRQGKRVRRGDCPAF